MNLSGVLINLDDGEGDSRASLVAVNRNLGEGGLEADSNVVVAEEAASLDGADNSNENSIRTDSSDVGIVTRADLLGNSTSDVVGVGGVRNLELGRGLVVRGRGSGLDGTESDTVHLRHALAATDVTGDNEVDVLGAEVTTSNGEGLDSLVDGGGLGGEDGGDLTTADGVSNRASSRLDVRESKTRK